MNERIKKKYQETMVNMRNCFIEILQMECAILLLITRKGYWAYKTLMDDDGWNILKKNNKEVWEQIRNGEKKIYTDRYLCKNLNLEEFRDKKIIIYDDTMTRGANLFFYYSYLIQKGIKMENITPVVYALSTEYPSKQSHNMLMNEYQHVVRAELPEEGWKEQAEKQIEEFNKALISFVRLAPESLSEVCVCETMLFNDNLCPLVIDLPILSVMKKEEGYTTPAYMNNGKSEGIHFTKEQFQMLISENFSWKFVENDFPNNYVNNCSSYFENKDIDMENLKNVVQNLVVKCKYKVVEDKVKAVFVPFAVFRSMNFIDTLNSFFVLWENTSHEQKVIEYIKKEIPDCSFNGLDLRSGNMESDVYRQIRNLMKRDHNLCVNLFRSVIFYVSAYTGSRFKAYVGEKTGVQLEYDWEFMKESMSESFIESFKFLIENRENHRNYFMNMPMIKPVVPVGFSPIGNALKKNATKERVEKSIRNRVLYKKNQKENQRAQVNKDYFLERVYVFESIESDLDREFVFNNPEEKKELLTMVLIDMLENSRLGNEIFVDAQQEIIYRGFRTGENSEILFYTGFEFFYAYIYAYYFLERSEYQEKYQKFIDQLELYFIQRKYKDSLISSEDMKFYEEYFRGLEGARLDEQIMNKNYVLNAYWNPDDSTGIHQYVDQAYRNVRVWMN